MNHELPMTLRLLLALLLTAPAICSDAALDDCRLVECPAPPACPADSRLQTASEELDELGDYDELPTSDPFPGVRVEALGPIQRSTEPSPPTTSSTASPAFTTPATSEEQRQRKRRELSFLQLALDEHEHPATKGCCAEATCVCNECRPEQLWPACAADEVAVELAAAQGTPGSCCATLACVKSWRCDEGAGAGPGPADDYWKDACTRCRCFGGDELCEVRCEEARGEAHEHQQQQDEARGAGCYSDYLERLIPAGESWLEDADCSECRCVDGEKACVTNLCAAAECAHPVKVAGRCCPVCVAEDATTTAVSPATTTTTTTTTTSPATTTEAATEDSSTVDPETEAEAATEEQEATTTEAEAMDTAGSPTTEIAPEEGGETAAETEAPEEEDASSETPLASSSTSAATDAAPSTATTTTTPTTTTSTTTEATDVASSTVGPSTATEPPVPHSSETEPTTTSGDSTSTSTAEFLPSSSASPASTAAPPAAESTTEGAPTSSTDAAPWTPIVGSSAIADATDAPPTAPSSAPSTDAATPGPSEAPALLPVSFHRQHAPEDPASSTPALDGGGNMNRVEPLNSASPNMVRTTQQQQMRRIFDEVDSLVLVVLALGSVLCLALGLVIRHSKNKKKIYSTIPSSETSLSQTSTNTVLTV